MKTVKLILLLLFSAFVARAQEDTLLLQHSVHGVVVDSRTGARLPSVSITVPGRNYATVSNQDGAFIIKSNAPIKRLILTCVGYKSLSLEVSSASIRARMVPEAYLLDPSTIISGDPWEIVSSAVSLIPDNYAPRPELLRCFYRETIQKRGRYISVSEAVTRLFKTSYDRSVRSDETALDKSRFIVSQRKRDTLNVKLMGGPTLAATADMVKNQDILLQDILAGLYDLAMYPPEYIGDRLQFVIRFRPSFYADHALYSGTLYIDREKLSFSRIEMSMDMSDPALVTRQLIRHKPLGLRFYPKEMSFVMTYRQDGAWCRMDYFRATFRFNCDWKKRGLATSYTILNETVVTDIIESAKQIPFKEQFFPTDFMADKAHEFLDPEFWKDYNIIEPSESLEHASRRLQRTY